MIYIRSLIIIFFNLILINETIANYSIEIQDSILIPNKTSDKKLLKQMLVEKNLSSFSDLIIFLDKSTNTHRTQEILDLSEKILENQLNPDEVSSEIEKLQKYQMLNHNEKKILSETIVKKLSQNLSRIQHLYFFKELCWLILNDNILLSESPHYEDYCQAKKISLKKLIDPEWRFSWIIIDGTTYDLSSNPYTFHTKKNQNIKLISDYRETIQLYKNIADISESDINKSNYLIDEKKLILKDSITNEIKKQLQLKKLFILDTNNHIQEIQKNNFFNDSARYIKKNKLEIASGIIISAFLISFLKDKSISFESSYTLH